MSEATFAGVVQLDAFRWMLPREGGMRVPGILIADRPLLEKMLSDRTLDQVKNAAHLPGILEASIAMPDAHWGYGLPVGCDIGCGVRLMRSRLARADLQPLADALADALFREVPCGVGSSGAVEVAK